MVAALWVSGSKHGTIEFSGLAQAGNQGARQDNRQPCDVSTADMCSVASTAQQCKGGVSC